MSMLTGEVLSPARTGDKRGESSGPSEASQEENASLGWADSGTMWPFCVRGHFDPTLEEIRTQYTLLRTGLLKGNSIVTFCTD